MTFSLPHLGHLIFALARSVMVSVASNSFLQLSHRNSYRGINSSSQLASARRVYLCLRLLQPKPTYPSRGTTPSRWSGAPAPSRACPCLGRARRGRDGSGRRGGACRYSRRRGSRVIVGTRISSSCCPSVSGPSSLGTFHDSKMPRSSSLMKPPPLALDSGSLIRTTAPAMFSRLGPCVFEAGELAVFTTVIKGEPLGSEA